MIITKNTFKRGDTESCNLLINGLIILTFLRWLFALLRQSTSFQGSLERVCMLIG